MTTTDPLKGFGTTQTSQREAVPGRSDQVKNNAGGFVFEIDPLARLRRFLTMGTAGGTYYVGQDKLTKENGGVILDFTTSDEAHKALVDTIVEISLGGRAPKQNPTLFALAIACQHGSTEAKQYARSKITEVVRTGTHLFIFVGYLKQFGGWSRGLRKAVGNWYVEKDADKLAYQLVKYRQREGYTHRDVLRLTHPKFELDSKLGQKEEDEELMSAIEDLKQKREAIEWSIGGDPDIKLLPEVLKGYELINIARVKPTDVLSNIKLPWEALPDSAMNDPEVWDKLLDNGVPLGALLRQLPRLTRIGMLPNMGGRTDEVTATLLNEEALKKARIHPINVLTALKTYRMGRSLKGSSTWEPTAKIVDALDEMFYASFGFVEPTGKRTMNCLDLSDSMTWPENVPPKQPLTCREIAAALAMVTVRTETNQVTMGFQGFNRWSPDAMSLRELPFSSRQRLDDVIRIIAETPPGGTDCSLPIVHALNKGLKIDTFVIYTDNETWAGNIHPYQALQQYRKASGIDAKLIVAAMTPTKFSIADPRDPGMLDISGFDSAVPQFISDFSAGRV